MANDIRKFEDEFIRAARAANTFSEALHKVEEANRRLNSSSSGGGIPNKGGSQAEAGKPADIPSLRTMGFVNPQSIGTSVHQMDRLALAAKQAGESIKQAYQGSATYVKELDRYVEQATGHVVVQAQMMRELKDSTGKVTDTQKFTATARVNPFTMEGTQYTAQQQAFANQAGGIDKANQALAKYGLTLGNVTGFYKDLNSNVARFSVVGTDGVAQAMGNMDQFGNATIHASRNAQTLAQNVGRNVEKVVEWAIATTLLYTVMNSLMQAGKELQDIEETMLDIQIATGAAGDELNRYYDAALQVANITGSDVTETLEAQAKAYRAAGSEADRFGTANILLRDSMILSRIAGIDQAKALDTLVAALRQTGNDLTEGTQLLDKWVATSKVIGVSVEDLAESFAITADVATTVGVTIDELNGIIGVLAEKTTLSGTEVGNAARTMFSGITSDEAVATLGEFGIAVRTVEGDMRDWMEINQDVVDMINAGILNDEQINKLANAMGGGSRRGPQLITLWRNFGAVSTVAGASMDANGEAAAAMEIKLDSLQAALNELHNAFNELVQTLGYDGGFLELMTDIVQISTDLVRSITEIADAFEGGAATITATMIALIALKRVMGNMNMSGFNNMGAAQGASQGWGGFPGVGNYLGQQGGPWHQRGFQGVAGAGGMIALGEGISGIAQGEGALEIGAKVGATLAGAFVGNMILPGAGGLIGAFIADTFVREVIGKQDALREISLGEAKNVSQQEELISKAFGGDILGAFGGVNRDATMKYSDVELAQLVAKAIGSGVTKESLRSIIPSENIDTIQAKGFNAEEAQIINEVLSNISDTNLETLLKAVSDYNVLMEDQARILEQTAQAIPTSTLNQAALLQGPQGAALRQSFSAQEASLYQEAGRTGNVEDYNKRTNAMKQVETATAAVAVAFYGADAATEKYVQIGNLLLNTNEEQRNKIILLTSAVNEHRDAIEEMQKVQGRGGTNEALSEEVRLLQQAQTELEHNIELTEKYNAIQFARENYVSPTQVATDPQGNPLTRQQANYSESVQKAFKEQDEYVRSRGIDPQAFRDSIVDPMVLAFADGYEEIRGLHPDFAKGMMDDMKELAEGMKEEISFAFKDMRDVNIDPGQLDQKIKYYENVMKQYEPYGYEEKKQNIGILGEGNQVRVLNTTMTALNLAIEDLTEVEKKQLEGQWNLPSGATAYVPINSLFAQSGGSAGAGGNPGLGENTGVLIDQGANKIDMAADKMLSAAEAMRIRDINSARWEGLGAQYASGARGQRETDIKVDNNINITPAQTILNLDGRILANVNQQFLAEGLSNASRTTPNGGPKII